MRLYLILIVTLLTTSVLWAQVDESVEVTREYIPQLERATKPSLMAEVVDTTTIRPEVDYNITPLSISTSVATKPIEPTQVTYWEPSHPNQGALKAGFGYPLSSLFDGYYSRYNADSGYFLASANHYGEYVNLGNPFDGEESCANTLNNSVGVAGGLHFGKQRLHTAFDYTYDIYYRDAALLEYKDESKTTYQSVDFDLAYGDSFIDMSRWNFAIDFGAEYFWNKRGNSNTIVGGGIDLARSYDFVGLFEFGAGYDSIVIGEQSEKRSTSLFEFDFLYSYLTESWSVEAGVIYKIMPSQYLDSEGVGVNSRLFTPLASFNYRGLKRTTLFAALGGDMTLGNYATLARLNPYILPVGLSSIRSTKYYTLQVGANGNLMRRNQFSYSLYGEWRRADDDMLWLLEVESVNNFNYMSVEYINQNTLSLNADIEYRVTPQFTIDIESHYYHYTQSENESGYAYGKPNFVFDMGMSYLRQRFSCGVSAKAVTARDVSYVYHAVQESVNTPATVDLGCFVDFSVGRAATIFVEANNLANQTIYEFYGYQELGINFMAGVRIVM